MVKFKITAFIDEKEEIEAKNEEEAYQKFFEIIENKPQSKAHLEIIKL